MRHHPYMLNCLASVALLRGLPKEEPIIQEKWETQHPAQEQAAPKGNRKQRRIQEAEYRRSHKHG